MVIVAARRLHQHLEIDQRGVAVGGAADLGEAALAVEVAGAGLRVVRVEAQRVGRPRPADRARASSIQARPMPVRWRAGSTAIAEQVERPLRRSEVPAIDRPRFPRRERERRDDAPARRARRRSTRASCSARTPFSVVDRRPVSRCRSASSARTRRRCAARRPRPHPPPRSSGSLASAGRSVRTPCAAAMSKTRFSGAGPNDAHGTTRVWFTPGFEKSQTPAGKIVRRRWSSAGVNDA